MNVLVIQDILMMVKIHYVSHAVLNVKPVKQHMIPVQLVYLHSLDLYP